jgi:hypothetical protein
VSKCPYTYPHRSKSDQIDYLVAHQSRWADLCWCPLVWNVKLYDVDTTGIKGDQPVRRWLDDRWKEHLAQQADDNIWNGIIEDMSRQYSDSEYTTWPGNDQGQWNFFFFGRSGGWMGLEKWTPSGYPTISEARFCKRDFKPENWREFLEDQPARLVRELYRGVRCMDADFTTQKVHAEFAYQMNWHRRQWEDSLHIDPLVDAMRTALWNKAQQDKIALELKAKGVTA